MTRYRELVPPPELRRHVLCGWTLGPVYGDALPVLPDGCMDIVWREGVGTILAGPDTAAVRPSRAPGSTVVGIRFRPGAAPPMLGVPASELRDLRVPLAEVWDSAGRVEEALEEAGSAPARLGVMAAQLRRRLPRAERPDGLVAEAIRRLGGPTPERVSAIGDELGISERQLRRRFNAAVGYGPKTLARVLRFRRLLALAARRPPAHGDLARLALDAGYGDQAHMTAECTRLGGAPPARLLATL